MSHHDKICKQKNRIPIDSECLRWTPLLSNSMLILQTSQSSAAPTPIKPLNQQRKKVIASDSESDGGGHKREDVKSKKKKHDSSASANRSMEPTSSGRKRVRPMKFDDTTFPQVKNNLIKQESDKHDSKRKRDMLSPELNDSSGGLSPVFEPKKIKKMEMDMSTPIKSVRGTDVKKKIQVPEKDGRSHRGSRRKTPAEDNSDEEREEDQSKKRKHNQETPPEPELSCNEKVEEIKQSPTTKPLKKQITITEMANFKLTKLDGPDHKKNKTEIVETKREIISKDLVVELREVKNTNSTLNTTEKPINAAPKMRGKKSSKSGMNPVVVDQPPPQTEEKIVEKIIDDPPSSNDRETPSQSQDDSNSMVIDHTVKTNQESILPNSELNFQQPQPSSTHSSPIKPINQLLNEADGKVLEAVAKKTKKSIISDVILEPTITSIEDVKKEELPKSSEQKIETLKEEEVKPEEPLTQDNNEKVKPIEKIVDNIDLCTDSPVTNKSPQDEEIKAEEKKEPASDLKEPILTTDSKNDLAASVNQSTPGVSMMQPTKEKAPGETFQPQPPQTQTCEVVQPKSGPPQTTIQNQQQLPQRTPPQSTPQQIPVPTITSPPSCALEAARLKEKLACALPPVTPQSGPCIVPSEEEKKSAEEIKNEKPKQSSTKSSTTPPKNQSTNRQQQLPTSQHNSSSIKQEAKQNMMSTNYGSNNNKYEKYPTSTASISKSCEQKLAITAPSVVGDLNNLNKIAPQFAMNQMNYNPYSPWNLYEYSYNIPNIDMYAAQKAQNKYQKDFTTSMAYGNIPNIYQTFPHQQSHHQMHHHQQQQQQQMQQQAAAAVAAVQQKEKNIRKQQQHSTCNKKDDKKDGSNNVSNCNYSNQQQYNKVSTKSSKQVEQQQQKMMQPQQFSQQTSMQHEDTSPQSTGSSSSTAPTPDMTSSGQSMGVYTPDSTTNSVHSLHHYGQCDLDVAQLGLESPASISSDITSQNSVESVQRPPSVQISHQQQFSDCSMQQTQTNAHTLSMMAQSHQMGNQIGGSNTQQQQQQQQNMNNMNMSGNSMTNQQQQQQHNRKMNQQVRNNNSNPQRSTTPKVNRTSNNQQQQQRQQRSTPPNNNSNIVTIPQQQITSPTGQQMTPQQQMNHQHQQNMQQVSNMNQYGSNHLSGQQSLHHHNNSYQDTYSHLSQMGQNASTGSAYGSGTSPNSYGSASSGSASVIQHRMSGTHSNLSAQHPLSSPHQRLGPSPSSCAVSNNFFLQGHTGTGHANSQTPVPMSSTPTPQSGGGSGTGSGGATPAGTGNNGGQSCTPPGGNNTTGGGPPSAGLTPPPQHNTMTPPPMSSHVGSHHSLHSQHPHAHHHHQTSHRNLSTPPATSLQAQIGSFQYKYYTGNMNVAPPIGSLSSGQNSSSSSSSRPVRNTPSAPVQHVSTAPVVPPAPSRTPAANVAAALSPNLMQHYNSLNGYRMTSQQSAAATAGYNINPAAAGFMNAANTTQIQMAGVMNMQPQYQDSRVAAAQQNAMYQGYSYISLNGSMRR